MQSHITSHFRKLFKDLPLDVKKEAKEAYGLWKTDPFSSALHFKALEGQKENIWSVRVKYGWRALGLRDGDEITWFWVGSHAGYDGRI